MASAANQLLLLTLCACTHPLPEGSTSHERSSFQAFERLVIPVLERRCGLGCHALDQATYAEFIEEEQEALYFPIDPQTGRFSVDPSLRWAAFEVVRGWRHSMEDSHRIDYGAEPAFSPLLRAPLATDAGGLPHRGIDVFMDEDDADHAALQEWIKREQATHEQPSSTLSPAQRFFGDEVLPVLERNGCFTASCHGGAVFNDLKLTEPLPRKTPEDPLRLSPAMIAANRLAALGDVSRFVNLGGDLRRSRLLVKNLPIAEGGVHQRGGNIQFFEDLQDPDVQILLAWMRLERAELLTRLTAADQPIAAADPGRVQGVAFLRSPRAVPRRFFDLDRFHPGTRLLVLPEGADAPIDLLPGSEGELQGFDVRYDGRAIVFSHRTSEDEGFRLWELTLDDQLHPAGPPRRLSFGPERLEDGALIHHIDPIYAPGPADPAGEVLDEVAVIFASNAAGDYATSDTWGLLGEADGGDHTTLVDAQRHEAPGTLDGRRLYIVDGPMRGLWRRIVHQGAGTLRLDAPLPEPADLRTVYVIEETQADYRSAFDVWRFVPERFAESLRRQTWTSAQERRPTLRTTGETMFTSVRNRGWQGDRPVFNGAIFRTHAGGFDYHIQGGNRSRRPLYSDSRELPSGLEVRLAHDPRNLWGGGQLILVDHGFGVDLEPDNPVDHVPHTASSSVHSSSQRFLPTHLPIFSEEGPAGITHTGLSAGGAFRDPYPHSDGTIFASHTPASLDHLDPAAEPDWDLYRLRFEGPLKTEDGSAVLAPNREPIAAANTRQFAEYHPRPIAIRLKERPVTKQKFAARSDGQTPQDDDGVLRLPDGLPGEVECYDYPLLQSFLTDFTPTGARDFREDELAWVRIVRQIPQTRSDVAGVAMQGPAADPFATPVSLGVHSRAVIVSEIPLEADGSFYAEVPSGVPLIVQGLDRERRALHSMNRWFYVQPGEKLTFSIPRSIFPTRCAGCHGSLTGDEQDILGPPDLISAASRVMATWDPIAEERLPPAQIGDDSVDFRRDIQPLLDTRCGACHGAESPAAGLDLSATPDGAWSRAYTSLHVLADPASGNHADKRFINEREALSSESFLIEKLTGRELHAPQTLDAPGVPHPSGAPLEAEELLLLTRWIDLGATFLGGEG